MNEFIWDFNKLYNLPTEARKTKGKESMLIHGIVYTYQIEIKHTTL